MSHNLGRIVADGRTFNQTTGLDLIPGPGPHGGPRFVMLHFDSVHLNGSAKLTVNLGYDTDVFTANSGSDFWSRPVDTSIGPIPIRITGGSGSARLLEYGSGEPSIPAGQTPGTSVGSLSNPDPFLQNRPLSGTDLRDAAGVQPGLCMAKRGLHPLLDSGSGQGPGCLVGRHHR